MRDGPAAAGVAVVLGATMLVCPTAPSTAAGARPMDLGIVDQVFGVAAGGTLSVTIELTSSSGARLQPTEIVVNVHAPVTSTSELDAVAADGPGTATDSVTVALPPAIATPEPRPVTVPVAITRPAPADDTLDVAAPGVHPVTIETTVGYDVARATTFVTVYDVTAPAAPTRLAVLAGVDDPGPWATPDEMGRTGDALSQAVELAAAVDAPLTFRLPPVAMAAAAPRPETTALPAPEGFARTAPSTAALAEAFAGDELLAQTAVPLDPSAMVGAGRVQVFTEQLLLGEQEMARVTPLAARRRTAWLADGPVSQAAASLLRELGVQMIAVPQRVAAEWVPDTGPFLRFEGVVGGPLPGLVTSALGDGLAATPTGTTGVVAAAQLMARTELERASGDVPALLLTTNDVGVPDPQLTAAYLRFADEVPGIAVVPVSDLTGPVYQTIAQGGLEGTAFPATAGHDLGPRAAAIDEVAARADQAATMLLEPARASGWATDLDRLLARTLDDGEAGEHLGTIDADVDTVLHAIEAPAPFTLTMTGTSSVLPLSVRNTAGEALRVTVLVQSPKLTAEPQTVEVPAGGEYEVAVPVRARSSGTFTIEVSVVSPDGQRVAGPVVVKARVTRVSGLSQVITGGAVLALASWWFSHFRRSRRAAMASGDPNDDEAMRPLEPEPVGGGGVTADRSPHTGSAQPST